MTGQLFISLLSPAVTLMLAAVFFILWRYLRAHTFLLLSSLGFVACAMAFITYDLVQFPNFEIGKLISNGFFYLSILCISVAAVLRYGRPLPWRLWAATVIAGFVGLAWFLYVDPRLDARIYVVNATLAAIVLVAFYALRDMRPRIAADYMLIALGIVALANFTLRPILTVWDGVDYQGYAGFQQSIYWTTVQFAAAILSIGVATTFLVAVAINLIVELRSESRTDQLSDLLNRRGFEEEASAALAVCAGQGRRAMMIVADLDHFKRINDSYGHQTGDAVIAQFSQILRAVAGETAIVGRMGGEEFAVFLPGADLHQARMLAEAVRNNFLAAMVPGLPRDVVLTASFGVYAGVLGEGLYDLVRGGDKALYVAKNEGRDRTIIASAPLRPVPNAV